MAPAFTRSAYDVDSALADLGLDAMPTDDAALAAAFRATMRRLHPDAGGSGDVEAITAAHRARDALLKLRAMPPAHDAGAVPCGLCRGTGMLRAGFGAKDCDQCEGKGYRE